jgi:hypothetical protein
MKYGRWALLAILIGIAAVAQPAAASGRMMQKSGKEEGGKKQDPERALANLIRGMQMDLESSSGRGFLSKINSAKFDDYPRFEDMIERLTREDTLRVYFRQANSSVKADSAQTMIDAEMEMTRKDAAAQLQRRRQQIVIDFQLTDRGWKIINITPREFFQPL